MSQKYIIKKTTFDGGVADSGARVRINLSVTVYTWWGKPLVFATRQQAETWISKQVDPKLYCVVAVNRADLESETRPVIGIKRGV